MTTDSNIAAPFLKVQWISKKKRAWSPMKVLGSEKGISKLISPHTLEQLRPAEEIRLNTARNEAGFRSSRGST